MKLKYKRKSDLVYYSPRYNRIVTAEKGFESDGATWGIDIKSISWWIHDKLCETGTWDDGTPVTNWQASWVLSDILYSEGHWFRAFYWGWATFITGCKNCQQNGMFRRYKGFVKK